MTTSWRIVQSIHVKYAFDGEGAKRYSGRWNLRGTPLIYTAESLSLAALEMLVHLEASAVLGKYVNIPVTFDDSLCQAIAPTDLPPNWRADPAPIQTQAFGTLWADSLVSAILIAPSTVVYGENNYLINPLHPDFKKITIGKPVDFNFDRRLIKTNGIVRS